MEDAPLAPLSLPDAQYVLSPPLSYLLTSSFSVATFLLSPYPLSVGTPLVLYASNGIWRCEGFAGGVFSAMRKCP